MEGGDGEGSEGKGGGNGDLVPPVSTLSERDNY